MVNTEKNNSDIPGIIKSQKIDIYRKNFIFHSESDTDNIKKPGIDEEDKLFFIKTGLIASFIIFFLIILLSFSSLFSNSFLDVQKNVDDSEVTLHPAEQSNKQSIVYSLFHKIITLGPTLNTFFFGKDYQLNFLITVGLVFFIFVILRKLIRTLMR